MSLKSIIVSGLLAFGVIAFAGCSSESNAKGDRICTPGANVFCRCADRSEGTKLCADDGLSFATPCSTNESRTECAGGEIPDPNTGQPVDDAGNPIDPNNDGGTQPTNDIDVCPGKSTSLTPNVDTIIEGDTTGAKDDAKGTGACAAGAGGGDHIYRIIPTGTGAVSFKVEGIGAMNPTVYIRTTCADEVTQVRCAETTGAGGIEQFSHNMISGKEYFLFIDGASSSAGKYKITARLTPGPFCGDGKVTDGEACDDINKTDNDGCDPSCQKPNGNPTSGASCPGHPVDLWSGKTVTATGSTNAPGYGNTWNKPSTSCDLAGTNNVADHIYQINPHASGILTVSITSTANLNVVARKNSCTDAASTTASMCKDKTQSINMLVTSGQPVWVAVDGGALSNNTGDYTITFKHTLQ